MKEIMTKRVLQAIKEEPSLPKEIAIRLGLKPKSYIHRFLPEYNWGKWSFYKAEKEGLIELKDEKWHITEKGLKELERSK